MSPKLHIKLINSYLQNRTNKLSINNSQATKNLTRSCPQGGGFSPFLWDIDYDDTISIPNLESLENTDIIAQLDINVESESDAQAFADDSQVIVVSENLFEGQKLTNLLLAKLSNHAKEKNRHITYQKLRR